MANRRFTSQFLYQFEAMPVLLSCNWVVDSANGNGLGIRSLKGAGIQSVFMHTTATPAVGNPNPNSGIIQVQLTDNYQRLLNMFGGEVSPVTGSALTATVAHTAYVIVSLGTATLAQWQAVGLPAGVAPAVGVAFTATATATIGGSAAVKVPGNSSIMKIETVGDPNQTLALTQSATNGGSIITLQALDTSFAKVAPADGTVISLSFYLSNSSVTLSGQ